MLQSVTAIGAVRQSVAAEGLQSQVWQLRGLHCIVGSRGGCAAVLGANGCTTGVAAKGCTAVLAARECAAGLGSWVDCTTEVAAEGCVAVMTAEGCAAVVAAKTVLQRYGS